MRLTVNFADSFQSDIVFSCSLVCSPPTVGEVQDGYGCALFSEYPVATILRDLSDVYAFEEGETPPTCAEQGPSMYALLFIGFLFGACMTETSKRGFCVASLRLDTFSHALIDAFIQMSTRVFLYIIKINNHCALHICLLCTLQLSAHVSTTTILFKGGILLVGTLDHLGPYLVPI